MPVTTRLATVEDAAAIARAHMRAWQVAYKGIVPQDYLDDMDLVARTGHWHDILTQQTLPNGVASPTNHVAVMDDVVIGIACVGLWRGAPDDENAGELWAMYVDPDSWRAGAGSALMDTTLNQLRAERRTVGYLWVFEDNPPSRAFYEAHGWVDDAVTQDDEAGGAMITERRYSIQLS